MRVAACQVPDVRDDVPRALAVIQAKARQAEAAGADVVLFPECFLQGYFTDVANVQRLAIDMAGEAFAPVRALSEQSSLLFIVGMIERAEEGCYNTAAVLQGGELLGRYRKSALLESERRSFRRGTEFPVFEVAGRRLGINICYDLCFPEPSQRLAAQGVQVLLCPCNNMLSQANAERWKAQHNTIRALRCRESGLWLVSSDVTGARDGRISYGPTALIDPDGTVLEQVPLSAEGLLIVDI